MEYFLILLEFLCVKGIKGILFAYAIPIVTGFLIFYKSDDTIYLQNSSTFHTNLITVLGILVGFTISTLTMLLTVSNPRIENAKVDYIGKKLFYKDVSLFDSVLVGLSYNIIIECLVLIGNFIYPVFISITSPLGKLFFAVNISLMIHIILLLMRNILDLYFILTKKSGQY